MYAVVDNHPMRVIREAVLLTEHAVETAGQVPKHHRGESWGVALCRERTPYKKCRRGVSC
ncbi:hypothetical protein GCM10007173_33650 [Glutamicibacter ardleyensis]|uniref:Uncharacterized protein n=1 Tax=Glutamicibacter ardleyensis TaxID=225894 RepID=A0ABQ2DSS1_9MICC|nr:hypothetical protein GCM10007173_33650 [Glutamicibacter ardleyensis]